MNAHTKGPWEFDAWGDIRAGHDTVICGMGKSCGLKAEYTLEPKPVMIANARLIAAAPDLLEVMKLALRLSREHRDFCLWAMEPFEAAIAKAEGRT
jgi:hypothetical protein